MTTETIYPSASGQDGVWIEGVSAISTADVYVPIGWAGAPYNAANAFARFVPASSIPMGATVNSCLFRLRSNATLSTTPCTWVVRAIKAAGATAPTTYAGAEGATRTTASVSWTPGSWTAGTQYSSPELITVLQELVDAYTVTAIVIYVEDTAGSGGAARQARMYDYGSQYPELYIDYTVGGGSTAIMTTNKGFW